MAFPTPQASAEPVPGFMSKQVVQARRFYLESSVLDDSPLSVVCVGWEKCARDYLVDRRSIPYFSVEFVAAGTGEVSLDGQHYGLEAGAVYSYGPDVPHCMRTNPSDLLDKYFVDFIGPRAEELMKEVDLAPGGFRVLPRVQDLKDAFELLLRLSSQVNSHAARMCALQLELLLLTSRFAGGVEDQIESARAVSTFEKCRRLVEDDFLVLRTVDEIAQTANVSHSYLFRLFRRFTGLTPYQYLSQVKMRWAASRLHGGDVLVREVADELGIDQFQFSRSFKRIHGLSPSNFVEFRRSRH